MESEERIENVVRQRIFSKCYSCGTTRFHWLCDYIINLHQKAYAEFTMFLIKIKKMKPDIVLEETYWFRNDAAVYMIQQQF